MKRLKYNLLFSAIFAIVALTACDQELEIKAALTNSTDDNLIRVPVEDETTRSECTTSNLTEFGFFVNNPDNPDYTYNNVWMIKEDRKWIPENGLTMQWKDKIIPVDIVAYAPYNEEALTVSSQIPINIRTDQRSEENLIASDFIAMKWKGFVPERDEAAGNSTIKNVEVFGNIIRMKAVCDFSKVGLVITALTTPDNTKIYPLQTADIPKECKATYECILIPQTGGLNIKTYFRTPNVYSYTVPSDESFKSGHNYNIEIHIKKDC